MDSTAPARHRHVPPPKRLPSCEDDGLDRHRVSPGGSHKKRTLRVKGAVREGPDQAAVQVWGPDQAAVREGPDLAAVQVWGPAPPPYVGQQLMVLGGIGAGARAGWGGAGEAGRLCRLGRFGGGSWRGG